MSNNKNQIIHFDSNSTTVTKNISNIYKRNSVNYGDNSFNIIPTYHSYNASFKLPNPLQGIKSVRLKSIELPVSFNNFRSNMSPLSFNYTNVLGINQTFNLPQVLIEQTYNDISSVITNLNSFFSNWKTTTNIMMTSEIQPIFFLSDINGNQRISFNVQLYANNSFTIFESFFTKNILGYNKAVDTQIINQSLSFPLAGTYFYDAQSIYSINVLSAFVRDLTTANTTNSANGYVYTTATTLPLYTGSPAAGTLYIYTTTFSNTYNINFDSYINFTISNLPITTNNQNQLSSTFKVPLNASSNVVYISGENSNFIQECKVLNNSQIIDQITVIITDRLGLPINPNYGEYSFSIEFDFNDVTPTTITPTPTKHYFTEFQ